MLYPLLHLLDRWFTATVGRAIHAFIFAIIAVLLWAVDVLLPSIKNVFVVAWLLFTKIRNADPMQLGDTRLSGTRMDHDSK